jgi:transcriptional regulator with XRE-family HTH domain
VIRLIALFCKGNNQSRCKYSDLEVIRKYFASILQVNIIIYNDSNLFYRMNIGERVKKLIKLKGVTPYVVYLKTGISQATLSRILNNATARPSIRSIEKLADYFGVNPEWILLGDKLDISKLSGRDISVSGGISQNNLEGDNVATMDTETFLTLLRKKDEQIDKLLDIINKQNKQ